MKSYFEEKSLIRERICTVLKMKGVSVYGLSDNPSKRSTLTRQINQNTTLTVSTLELIADKFPDISAEWLLRGEGSYDKMDHITPHIYASNGSIVQGGNNSGDAMIAPPPSQFELYGKDEVIMAKDAEIANLNARILDLQNDKKNLNLLLQALTKCGR